MRDVVVSWIALLVVAAYRLGGRHSLHRSPDSALSASVDPATLGGIPEITAYGL